METIKGLKRTNYCGELRIEDAGKEVTLFGWCQRQRDLGNLIFIDLRDRTGLVQLSFNDTTDREVFAKAQSVRAEYVVAAVGTVCERESKTNKIATGDIEINVKEFRIISKAETPPFEIAKSEKVGDETTLKYRYLNLRNEKLTQNILMRHKIAKIAREYFYDNDFIEIETPMMIKSTPEGARDYVVPSRVHNGKFYALPQSPQIYKQLCMIAGFDRYIQLARCFRDEDLRADRQPEFTQIDLEMSFVDTDDIMEMAEGFIKKLMKETIDVDIDFPLPRMTFAEAQEKYGSDKPDTRFGMLIEDITAWAEKTDFVVFKNAVETGGTVRAIVAKNAASTYTRKKIDKLTEHAKGIGAKGLAYIAIHEDGSLKSSFAKFMTDEEMQAIVTAMDGQAGDLLLFAADCNKIVWNVLGALRVELAGQMGLLDKNEYKFLWVTEFPQFEWSDEENRFVAMHHPFTMPMDEDLDQLETNPGAVRAKAYDIVLNGTEIGGGSVRIHQADVQARMFKALGMSDEVANEKFGFLLDAFKYGVPPHAGLAYGMDRLVMLMAKCDSIRDVIAFPKVKDASCLLTNAPDVVDAKQLEELSIAIEEEKEV